MEQKQQIATRLKEANNILVTVSNNPSVDQLASCIGLTLALNKMGKHATAVFSGAVPSTLEFLQPEKTLEKDTNSLRDFIIALDKSKADKLRYKVEDKVVKIFITPYRTSISESDLNFSQGDFNVDVVIALGVHNQTDLDQAITSHGRILHDATVATVNIQPGGELGSINWLEVGASSLSELAYELVEIIDKKLVDAQIATAMLTGIVAETHRFSNEKTSPNTMSVAAELMAAGANQQLVATKLEEAAPTAPIRQMTRPSEGEEKPAEAPAEKRADDGTLEIAHIDKGEGEESKPAPKIEEAKTETIPAEDKEEERTPQIHIDEQGALRTIDEEKPKESEPKASTDPTQHMEGSRMILQPPSMSSQLSASGMPDDDFGSTDPLSLPQPSDPLHSMPPAFSPPASAATAAPSVPYMPSSMTPSSGAASPSTGSLPDLSTIGGAPSPQVPASPISTPPSSPAPTTPAASSPGPTLTEIEKNVHSPHVGASQAADAPQTDSATAAPAGGATPASDDTPTPASDDLAKAREAVMQAIASQPAGTGGSLEPIHALNAQPLGDRLHDESNLPNPASPPPPGPPPMLPPIPGQ